MGRGLSNLQRGILCQLWRETLRVESSDETSLPPDYLREFRCWAPLGRGCMVEDSKPWRAVQYAWTRFGGVVQPERYCWEDDLPPGLTWIRQRRQRRTRAAAASYSKALSRLEARRFIVKRWLLCGRNTMGLALTAEGRKVAGELSVNVEGGPTC